MGSLTPLLRPSFGPWADLSDTATGTPASMSAPMTSPLATTLGGFLRATRERLRPTDFGLPDGHRRRTTGLRREEVASLCSISPTWYTWIEQGRSESTSAATLVQLAEGLRLSKPERAYLFQLAGKADPAIDVPPPATAAPLDALTAAIASPAYVLDRYWNAVAWNPAAEALFSDWLGQATSTTAVVDENTTAQQDGNANVPGRLPNLLQWMFTAPAAQTMILDWDERAQRLVAEYRADSASARHEIDHQKLVQALCQANPVFDRVWRAQKVLDREGGLRSFMVRGIGVRRYWQYTMRMAQQAEVKLVVLHPL